MCRDKCVVIEYRFLVGCKNNQGKLASWTELCAAIASSSSALQPSNLHPRLQQWNWSYIVHLVCFYTIESFCQRKLFWWNFPLLSRSVRQNNWKQLLSSGQTTILMRLALVTKQISTFQLFFIFWLLFFTYTDKNKTFFIFSEKFWSCCCE